MNLSLSVCALALSGILAAGCSSSPSSSSGGSSCTTASAGTAGVSSFCASLCTRNQECVSTVDVQTCESNCAASATMFESMRCDFNQAIEDCYTVADCSGVSGGTAENTCITNALGTTSPSSQDTSFCSALTTAAQNCGATTFSDSDCTNLTKPYGDDMLATAQACTAKACADVGACVAAALPGYDPGISGGGGGGGGASCTSDSQCSGTCPQCSAGSCSNGYVSTISGECVY